MQEEERRPVGLARRREGNGNRARQVVVLQQDVAIEARREAVARVGVSAFDDADGLETTTAQIALERPDGPRSAPTGSLYPVGRRQQPCQQADVSRKCPRCR